MPTPAFKTDWPTFDAASNTIHDLVKSMGVGEVLMTLSYPGSIQSLRAEMVR
jgi:hypothetical protein